MTPASPTPAVDRARTRLRLVRGDGSRRRGHERARSGEPGAGEPGAGETTTASRHPAGGVLVAGADESRRAKMLDELQGLLPEGTAFQEAGETWQVLSRAGDSRMVILTGDLGDISAQGLLRVLSRRYPLLPVISLSPLRRSVPTGSLDAAVS